MSGLIVAAFRRHLVHHPWQLALALVGIAIGVAVVVAIRLTQMSAVTALEDANRTTFGDASHRLSAHDGGLLNSDVAWLHQRFPQILMEPVLSGQLSLASAPTTTITLVGIDPIARQRISRAKQSGMVQLNPTELMATPNTGVVNHVTAEKLGISLYGELELLLQGESKSITIVDFLPGTAEVGGIVDNFLIVDIATAQEFLGVIDSISHLNLSLSSEEQAEFIRHVLAETPNLELIDLSEEARGAQQLTAAFYSNLNALSLMALIVGMFLIYNTEMFLVVQRREMIGRLRALGVSRAQILGAILSEAAFVGAFGSAFGALIGVVLANGLLDMVSTTVNDLYYATSNQTLVLDVKTISICVAMGIVVTLLAVIPTGLQATRVEPTLAMRTDALGKIKMLRYIGVALAFTLTCTIAAIVALIYTQSPTGGFIGIALIVLGFAGLCPLTIVLLAKSGIRILPRDHALPEHLGFGSVIVALSRTGPACAALMVATAAAIGIGMMVMSFRMSVENWLDGALQADAYIAESGFDNNLEKSRIDPAIVEQLMTKPFIDSTTTVIRRRTDSNVGKIVVSGFQLNAKARSGFEFISGEPTGIWEAWASDTVVIVTEPFAYHHSLNIGDTLKLFGDHGHVQVRVIGIYRDYASERGSVSMSRSNFDRYWDNAGHDGIGVYASPSVSRDSFETTLRATLRGQTTLAVSTSKQLKETSLSVFDRTFLITELLRTIAIAVSFVGVFGALLAQQLEKTREYGVLRAIGFSNGEMMRTVLAQTTTLGLAAAGIAIPVGLLIGIVLIEIVNPRSFGWTMSMTISPSQIAGSCLVALFAAIIAGIYPAYRAAHIEPAVAIREE